MNKIKFMEARMKLEKFICRHFAAIVIFMTLVLNDFWNEKLNDIVDAIGDIIYDIDFLDLSGRMSNEISEMTVIYVLCVFCNWLIRFTIKHMGKLFIKKPTEKKTERSA